MPTEKSPPFPKDNGGAGRLLFEHALKRGDVMYIPRGSHHRATAQEQVSVHVTIGLHTKKWSDLMVGLITDMIEKHEVFRRSLPPGFLAEGWSPYDHAEWQEMLNHLGGAPTTAVVDDFRQRMLKWCSMAPTAARKSTVTSGVKGDTFRKIGFAHLVSQSKDNSTLHLPGLTLEVNANEADFLRWVLAQERIAGEDLQILLDPANIVLFDRLLHTSVFIIEPIPLEILG